MADPSPKWTGIGRSVSALCAAIAAWTAWPAEASVSGSTFSPCQVHPQRRSVRRGASLYARDSILVQVAWSPQPVERSWFPETKGVGHGDRILPWSVVFNEFTQAAPSSQLYCVQVMLVKFAPCALEGPLLSLCPQTPWSPLAYGNISELLPRWGCSFSRSPRRRYSRKASTEDDFARAACGAQLERGFKHLARQAPTSGLLAAPGPGQGFSRTTSVKGEGDTQHPRALAVTLTVGILRIPPWLREAWRLSAAGSLN